MMDGSVILIAYCSGQQSKVRWFAIQVLFECVACNLRQITYCLRPLAWDFFLLLQPRTAFLQLPSPWMHKTGTLASNGLACELAQDLLASSMREESAGIESVTCNLNSSVVLGCASLEKQADIASYLANIEHTI